jgi:type I pantothenate kinase
MAAAKPEVRDEHTTYISFSRQEWKKLRDSTPLTLTLADLENIRGINEKISLEEVVDVYLPLSRLLNLYYQASQRLYEARRTFLGRGDERVPFIIGIAGSVAVGKSTISRLLKTLLSKWPGSPRVELLPTDGFLYPNSELERRGIMKRKGFPESYNLRELIHFLYELKSGNANLKVPVYSHIRYDVVPGEFTVVESPDIVILEGLNVLQTRSIRHSKEPELMVSDFFDFSIYIDAEETAIKKWFTERFRVLRDTAFRREDSYFHSFARLSEEETEIVASGIWDEINAVNLRENIAPTKYHAHLILEKGENHEIIGVRMRKI